MSFVDSQYEFVKPNFDFVKQRNFKLQLNLQWTLPNGIPTISDHN
jgi:hypothetical protein